MDIILNGVSVWMVDGHDWQKRSQSGLPPLCEGNRSLVTLPMKEEIQRGLRTGHMKIDRIGATRLRVVHRHHRPGDNFYLIDRGEVIIRMK